MTQLSPDSTRDARTCARGSGAPFWASRTWPCTAAVPESRVGGSREARVCGLFRSVAAFLAGQEINEATATVSATEVARAFLEIPAAAFERRGVMAWTSMTERSRVLRESSARRLRWERPR